MSYKSLLLEYCQKRKMGIPVYRVRREGPGHVPRFTATVRVATGEDQMEYTGHTSNTTKRAEHDATKVALECLNAVDDGVDCAAATDVVDGADVVDGVVVAINPSVSHKCMLHELCQRLKLRMSRYDWEYSGHAHDPKFRGVVLVFGERLVAGTWTTSMKSAKDGAAERALDYFRNNHVGGATV